VFTCSVMSVLSCTVHQYTVILPQCCLTPRVWKQPKTSLNAEKFQYVRIIAGAEGGSISYQSAARIFSVQKWFWGGGFNKLPCSRKLTSDPRNVCKENAHNASSALSLISLKHLNNTCYSWYSVLYTHCMCPCNSFFISFFSSFLPCSPLSFFFLLFQSFDSLSPALVLPLTSKEMYLIGFHNRLRLLILFLFSCFLFETP
jgi:hypothetical protein